MTLIKKLCPCFLFALPDADKRDEAGINPGMMIIKQKNGDYRL
jgi:hypothetical protein